MKFISTCKSPPPSYGTHIIHTHSTYYTLHITHRWSKKKLFSSLNCSFLLLLIHCSHSTQTKRTHAVSYNDKGSNYNCLWYFFSLAKGTVQHQFMRIIQTEKKMKRKNKVRTDPKKETYLKIYLILVGVCLCVRYTFPLQCSCARESWNLNENDEYSLCKLYNNPFRHLSL